ncbi:Cytochrome c553 [Palleronia marisminoris]|uniref:Cytochrome c4 n=1 Tax=Palleronia marisminoris TaxID=315423 RepID=A0A1Y5SMQ0_9RHOB|nr:c-type cytochrome [Palleronia marisminoris]SFG83589.1 Cytochrome c553 [Palleronia marisminoris]SLN41300.1 Cytochrome c4 precursor [Palleronia marisminoris]
MKIDLRSVFLTLAALAVLGVIGASAVVGFGLYNVSARAGHLPGVKWILHTTYQQAVTFRAPPESAAPELTDAMASLGAKHFDAACRVCHSAPGYARTATMLSMKPEPPHITAAVGDWSPSELHWIVYEGVKMSGMPHWPADRPDEVWSTVAFLTRVQEGLNRQQYDALTAAPKADPRGFAYCATCHEETGVSGNPDIPRLDILSEEYMTRALLAFRTGARDSGIMQHAATEVPVEDLPRFAAIFAAESPTGEAEPETSLTLRGRRIALEGAPGSDVPACASCHGPWPETINPAYPSLSGQYRPYLETQLRLWRAGERGGSEVAEIMHQAAARLSDAEIEAVSAWYSSRNPDELNRINDGEN